MCRTRRRQRVPRVDVAGRPRSGTSDCPGGTTAPVPPASSDTNTVWTSGWATKPGLHVLVPLARTRDFAGSGRLRGAAESGQPVRVIDFSRQPRLLATTFSAPRQCLAWLSPTSATVSVASCGSAPDAQTSGSALSGEQKPFGASSAAPGRRLDEQPQLRVVAGRAEVARRRAVALGQRRGRGAVGICDGEDRERGHCGEDHGPRHPGSMPSGSAVRHTTLGCGRVPLARHALRILAGMIWAFLPIAVLVTITPGRRDRERRSAARSGAAGGRAC